MSSQALDRSLIRPLHLFDGMLDEELDDVLSTAGSRRYVIGETLFEQGQRADKFYLLLHGRLRVTQVTPQGQQVVMQMINPGDMCGIAKALQRPDYPGTATAAADSISLYWPTQDWTPILSKHPVFAVNAMQTIGQRLQEAQARVREMSTEAAERRIAHSVLRLAGQSGRQEPEGIRIDFPISKQDIAEMAGTTLHTVSRVLSAWESAGIVDGGRQKLLVKDPHRLLLIAEGVEAGPSR